MPSTRQSTLGFAVRKRPTTTFKESETPKKKKKNAIESTPYQAAKLVFSSSKVDEVVGREKECDIISGFLNDHIVKRKSSSMYISGPPGTGKSLCVSYVASHVVKVNKCIFINVNCMTLRTPNVIFGKILEELKGDISTKESENKKEIEKILASKGKDKSMIVLILDEIDQLDNKNQSILHVIFEWASLKQSRLVLLGIANALDFATRTLCRLSNLGLNPKQELRFRPYEKNEILEILKKRLQSGEKLDLTNLIEPSALHFCALKIASLSGDMRKALDVCRQAIEHIERKDKKDVKSPLKEKYDDNNASQVAVNKKIDVNDIATILNRIYGLKTQEAKQLLPFQQQMVLCSLFLFSKYRKCKEVRLSKCHDVFQKICAQRAVCLETKSRVDFLHMCQLLEVNSYIAIKPSKDLGSTKLSLQIDEFEVEHILNDKTLLRSILQHSSALLNA